jgi:tetratricopeptide (TPR) repeat protein
MNLTKGIQVVALLAILAAGSLADVQGKIPVTTSSPEALAFFLEGRTLVDNLRLTDAIDRFNRAVAKDPGFALAYLYLAQTAPTAKEFFAYLDKASSLGKSVSKGEQLWIEGFKAGSYADPETQRKDFQNLVDLFPDDERAQMLLGISYFGQQDYERAVQCLERATSRAPDFPPAYNQLGYAYRSLERFKESEQTFKKYTELIPNDPNPYDSYAELLLKLGRFDESIVQYRKALTIDSHFANSFAGIAAALTYKGKHDEARTELQKAYTIARNDGERRAALFAIATSFIDEGKLEAALKEFDKQYALGEKTNDVAAMAGDLVATGNIQLELGRHDAALSSFEKAVTMIRKSGLASEVKENAGLIYHYNVARAAVMKKDFVTARSEAEKFRGGAEAKKNKNQIRLAHELAGMIALTQSQYDKAINELQQASKLDPYNLYRLALAYQGSGNKVDARKLCTAAAHFNVLPLMNYAFIRLKAEKMLSAI